MKHFTYRKLLQFVLPSIMMMIVTSVYSIVDGYFVSNYAGKNAFAAVNLVMPVLMALGAFGFMIGTGGSALVAFSLGEGKKEKANRIFSMLIKLMVIVGILLSIGGILFMPQIVKLLGASTLIFDDCVIYGRILLVALTFFFLQDSFQSFLVTAERAKMGLAISIASGALNVFLDYMLVKVLAGGVIGAGLATAISQILGGCVPLIYFMRRNKSLLHLEKVKMDFRLIGKACANGSSEMLSNLSTSLVGILYNYQLIKYATENGIAAYGVLMYVSFIFMAIFLGYAIGINPIIGFQYGSENHSELKNVYKKSLCIIFIVSITMTISAELFAGPISQIFVGYDRELLAITKNAMSLYSFSFLLSGFNIFGSAFFTGLNNGLLSAIISIFRTLIFQIAAIYILPLILGINGIWIAIVVAEGITLMITATLLITNKKKYKY